MSNLIRNNPATTFVLLVIWPILYTLAVLTDLGIIHA